MEPADTFQGGLLMSQADLLLVRRRWRWSNGPLDRSELLPVKLEDLIEDARELPRLAGLLRLCLRPARGCGLPLKRHGRRGSLGCPRLGPSALLADRGVEADRSGARREPGTPGADVHPRDAGPDAGPDAVTRRPDPDPRSDLGEKRAFEELVDFITERRKRTPGLHVYHYNLTRGAKR